MVRRTILLVVLAALVVTAGCLGTGGGATDGTTDEPTTAPVDASDDGAGDGGGDADADDGAGDGTDGDDLIVTEPESALREAGSFTTTLTFTGTYGDQDPGVTRNTYYVDLENERFYGHVEGGTDVPGAAVMEWFSADDVTYVKMGDGEEAIYFKDTEENWFSMSEATLDDSYYAYAAERDDWLVRAGTETFDGVPVTRYEATGVEKWAYFRAYVEEEGRITDFQYVILVDDDGLVRSMTWHLAGVDESSGEPQEFDQRVEMRLTDVGATTVEDPDWLEEAKARAITAE